ncbi:MAG: response regulator [Betaproteobacteria bacterium]|nr:response regulator [Betaproteobacteria bacterium]
MPEPLRLLLIEDSEEYAELLLEEIRHGGYDPIYRRADTARATQDALMSEFWDIVISNYTMPQFSGLAALKIVQQHDPDLPFIINSGNIGEDIAVEAMRAGAHDYLMEGNRSRLIPAIERELRESVERRRGRQAQRELEENEARFRAIVSNVPGVVFQLQRDGKGGFRFSYVSDGSNQLLELTPQQMQDDASLFYELVLDGGGDVLRKRVVASAQTLQPLSWEGRFRVASGDITKWIEIRMRPRPLNSSLVQWDGIMENISQRKQAESELLRSRQQLSALSAHLQKAKEIERTRIAREVHDDIGGNLTALKIDLLWLVHRIDRERNDLLDKARSLETLVDRTMEITSRIARDLRPPLLDLGLVAAIEWEAAEFQKRMEIPCVVTCKTEDLPVDPDLGNAAFSIFREILTNISKHAAATKVEVELGTDGTMLIMCIVDNGRGMAQSDLLKRGSFGLRGMLERARSLGGEIRFDGQSGTGTSITALLPLDPVSHTPDHISPAGPA